MNCPKCGLINTGNLAVGLAMPQCMCQWQNTQAKCRIETVPAQETLLPKREWVGLTDEERNHARNAVTYSQLAMTASEWTEAVQIETEKRLKEKNT